MNALQLDREKWIRKCDAFVEALQEYEERKQEQTKENQIKKSAAKVMATGTAVKLPEMDESLLSAADSISRAVWIDLWTGAGEGSGAMVVIRFRNE